MNDYHPLDLYGDDSPPGIDAIATISAGWKERKEGGMGTPRVSRDGKIILHDDGGRAPGLKAALEATGYKSLTIAFPVDDPAVFIQERFVAYSASNLLAYGDETQITTIDPKTGERAVLEAGTPSYKAALANCKVARSVYFVLAEWTDQGPEIVFPDGLGYYRLRFTSRNSIRSLLATIQSVGRFTQKHIAGIPFTLSLDYRDLADGKGARHNAPVWTILMQPPQAMRLTSKTFAQITQGALAQGQALMLPAPSQETLEVALYEGPEPDLDDIEEIEAGGRCDYDHWIRAWHQAVKDTPYATDEGRAGFISWFTDGDTYSLADFLQTATEKEAAGLIAAVLEKIKPEPDEPKPAPTPEQAAADLAMLWPGPEASNPTGHKDAPHPKDGGRALSGIRGPLSTAVLGPSLDAPNMAKRPPVAPDTSLMDYRWQEAKESIEAHAQTGKTWDEPPLVAQDKTLVEFFGQERSDALIAAMGNTKGMVYGINNWLLDARKMHNPEEIKSAADGIIADAQVKS